VAIFEVVDDRGLPFTARVATWLPPATPSSLGMTREEFQGLRRETQPPLRSFMVQRSLFRRSVFLIVLTNAVITVGLFRVAIYGLTPLVLLVLLVWIMRTRTLLMCDWWTLRLAMLRRGRCAACGQPLRDGSRVNERVVCPECGAHWEVPLTESRSAESDRTAGERVSSTLLA
jgi:hypothetical protein